MDNKIYGFIKYFIVVWFLDLFVELKRLEKHMWRFWIESGPGPIISYSFVGR